MPPFPRFVQTWLYIVGFTQRRPSGTILPSPHSPRNHPPHCTVDAHLLNRSAVKADPRSTPSRESGAVVCAKSSSATSTNANDILRTLESERCVSPVGKLSAVGETIRNAIMPGLAEGWNSGGTGISDLKMLLSRSTDRLRRTENGFCGDVQFCPNFYSQTETHSLACYFVYSDFRVCANNAISASNRELS